MNIKPQDVLLSNFCEWMMLESTLASTFQFHEGSSNFFFLPVDHSISNPSCLVASSARSAEADP